MNIYNNWSIVQNGLDTTATYGDNEIFAIDYKKFIAWNAERCDKGIHCYNTDNKTDYDHYLKMYILENFQKLMGIVNILIMNRNDSLTQIKGLHELNINSSNITNLTITVVKSGIDNIRKFLQGFNNLINLNATIRGFSTVILSLADESIADYKTVNPVLVIILTNKMKQIDINCENNPEFRITESAAELIRNNKISVQWQGINYSTNTFASQQSIDRTDGIEKLLNLRTNPDITGLILQTTGPRFTSRNSNNSRGATSRSIKVEALLRKYRLNGPKGVADKSAKGITKRDRKSPLRNKKRSIKKQIKSRRNKK